eukprot:TRINITY_DN70939_c0_g1_i1.p1 TRINITY_DN70939_c0_g1~~TRINITY_DN70939_c0_g1_i1.p1  ORF type:complete len:428 (+),score=125.50 TRINITY_DN70939_c0_g1_i1:68-1285(+)
MAADSSPESLEREAAAAARRRRLLRVGAVCSANCVISVVSTCLYYHELRALRPFPFFATQLGALMSVAVAGPLVAAHAAWLRCAPAAETGAPQKGTAATGGAARTRPALVMLAVAVFAAAQNTLEIASIDGIGDDNLPPILQQASVPLTFALSAALLNVRYGRTHAAGAALVVLGVAATFVPLVSGSVSVPWALLFVASRLPQSLAGVAAEGLLSRAGASPTQNVVAALRLSVITQALGVPLSALCALLLTAARGQPPSAVGDDYREGAQCLFRRGGGVYDMGAPDAAAGSPADWVHSHCADAWRAAALFAVPGTLYLVSEYHVLSEAGATAYFLLAALQLPIQDTVLSMPQIMGAEASSFHPLYGVGVVIIMAGLCLYGLRPPERAAGRGYGSLIQDSGGDESE